MSPKDGMVMQAVPAGQFFMGSTDGLSETTPNMYLDSFWIDQTEVTNAMYTKCVQVGACQPPILTGAANPRYADPLYADHPVTFVSWNDAQAYCTWAGRRLPTEAEWEKAARGTDGRLLPWGNSTDPNCTIANVSFCTDGTTKVGSYPAGASPYNVLDMLGNVWEWVANTDSSLATQGVRGGGFQDYPEYTFSGEQGNPDMKQNDLGFRCALSAR